MHIGHRRISLAALLLFGALAITRSAQAAPVAAWELLRPEPFRNASWSFGDVFTVGASDIFVTALGAFDDGKNGFVSNAIPVGLFRESDGALLVETTLSSADPLLGNYRFRNIAGLNLLANGTYRVVAVNRDDLYNIATGTPNLVDPRISWIRYGYCQTTAVTRCDAFTGSERTWMANFLLDDRNEVPEPAALFLLGLGLAASARRLARKR